MLTEQMFTFLWCDCRFFHGCCNLPNSWGTPQNKETQCFTNWSISIYWWVICFVRCCLARPFCFACFVRFDFVDDVNYSFVWTSKAVKKSNKTSWIIITSTHCENLRIKIINTLPFFGLVWNPQLTFFLMLWLIFRNGFFQILVVGNKHLVASGGKNT